MVGQLTRDNHYVPQLYLKHFAQEGIVETYRLLVSREEVSTWKSAHIAAVGYQRHLYTRMLIGGPSDQIENWLYRDFEQPAEIPLKRAVSGDRLSSDDYALLARFVAAQIVRTPAYFMRNHERWNKQVEAWLDQTIAKLPDVLRGEVQTEPEAPWIDDEMKSLLPIQVIKEPLPDGRTVSVKARTFVGRPYWFFAMKVALTSTWKRLASHKWTILTCHQDLPWFTSDDPVLLLNFTNIERFDFGGGWGRPGSEIILPISPRQILYTQIERRVPERGNTVSLEQNILIRNLIARHAHRYIYSQHRDEGVPFFRPRRVDAVAFEHEKREWDEWHKEQSAMEQEFMKSK